MKTSNFFCFVLFFAPILFSIGCRNRPKPVSEIISKKERPVEFHNGTNDMMFLDSVRYLMDKTPLAVFGEYLSAVFGERIIDSPGYPVFTVGEDDKYYMGVWEILDSTLYLTQISDVLDVPRLRSFGDSAYYSIEKLVHGKFEKTDVVERRALHATSRGALPAYWYSGRLTIKKANNTPTEGPEIPWYDLPVWELSFDKGKLVGVRGIKANRVKTLRL